MCLFTPVMVSAQDIRLDTQASLQFDNNITRGEAAQDIQSDALLVLGIHASQFILLTPKQGLTWQVGADYTQLSRYAALSHLSANAGLAWRVQPVIGYTNPWFELGVQYTQDWYQNSAIREGESWLGKARIGKRFTDRWGANIGLAYEDRGAKEGEVFDWGHRSAFISTDYKIGLESRLYGSVSKIWGDQNFVATPKPSLKKVAKAIVNDPVFGNRRAYRLAANSYLLEIGLNTPISNQGALDIGVRYFDSQAEGGHDYDSTELRLSYLQRF